MSWEHLSLQVLLHFADVCDRAPHSPREAREWQAHLLDKETRREQRRAWYAWNRAIRSPAYLRYVERRRRDSARRRTDPGTRPRLLAALAALGQERRERRTQIVAPLTCPEPGCGRSLPPPATYGPLRKFCSEACMKRAARRAWYRRNAESEGAKRRTDEARQKRRATRKS